MASHYKLASFHSEDIDTLLAKPELRWRRPHGHQLPTDLQEGREAMERYLALGAGQKQEIESRKDSASSSSASNTQQSMLVERVSRVFRTHVQLEDGWTFLNHGAFGVGLRHALEDAQTWRTRAEAQPLRFLDRELFSACADAIEALSDFLGVCPSWRTGPCPDSQSRSGSPSSLSASSSTCPSHRTRGQLALLPNATAALCSIINNSVAPLIQPGENIVLLDVGYGSVKTMAEIATKHRNAELIVVPCPLPIQDPRDRSAWVRRIVAAVNARTRLLIIDHVASNSGLVLPCFEVVDAVKRSFPHVLTLIDGAHGPGAHDLDLGATCVDFYVGNVHKWMSAPRGVGFLYVTDDLASTINPCVLSHGSAKSFQNRFVWDGNRDYSPYLTLPAVIDYWQMLGPNLVRSYQRQLLRDGILILLDKWDDGDCILLANVGTATIPSSTSTFSLSSEPEKTKDIEAAKLPSSSSAAPFSSSYDQLENLHGTSNLGAPDGQNDGTVVRTSTERTENSKGETAITNWHGGWFGTMATIRLPLPWMSLEKWGNSKNVQDWLYARNIEVPVKTFAGQLYLRISVHVYNSLADFLVLADAINSARQQES